MLAIIDKRAPNAVKKNLSLYIDEVFEFESDAITYNSIAGHPDIFMYQDENNIVLAPNTPIQLTSFLTENKVVFSTGKNPVGKSLKECVLYNCISTNHYFFCKKDHADVSIQNLNSTKIQLNIPQAFARCNMFAVENSFVTSDKGIVKVLKNNKLGYLYFDPSEINIIDHKNGFIGGTMGVYNDKVFFMGNILKHADGKVLEKFITNLNMEIICLGNDFLYDGGSIFFVK